MKVKFFTPEQLGKLSASKLEEAISKANAIAMSFGDKLIEEGRGHERASETRAKAKEGDPLAMRWAEANDAWYDLICERDRRKAYHGSTKPIRSKIF